MIRVLMPTLRSAKGWVIPQDWVAVIPAFECDGDYESWLTGKLMPLHKHDPQKANVDAKERIALVGYQAFLHSLKLFVMRCADEYGKRYPDLRNPDKTLKGFDPASLQAIFVPHRVSKGRNGDPEIRKALETMAQKTRAEMYPDKRQTPKEAA